MTKFYTWDREAFLNRLSPAGRRNWNRHTKVIHLEIKILRKCFWLKWPILTLVTDFWISIFDEGIKNTCKPRWGVLTFAYLNDGIKPTVWHTWQEITNNSKYSGIYTQGAPRNKKEADIILSKEYKSITEEDSE